MCVFVCVLRLWWLVDYLLACWLLNWSPTILIISSLVHFFFFFPKSKFSGSSKRVPQKCSGCYFGVWGITHQHFYNIFWHFGKHLGLLPLPRRFRFSPHVRLFVGLSAGSHRNYWADFHPVGGMGLRPHQPLLRIQIKGRIQNLLSPSLTFR